MQIGVWCVLGLASGLAGCGSGSVDEGRPNVVLVVLEGVRADHVSAYGFAKPTTPALDALAAEGTRFDRCRASAPATLGSIASMFTGLHAYQHGAHPVLVDDFPEERPLDLRHRTLAELLGDAGYATAAFVSDAPSLGVDGQLDQGFGEYVIEAGPGTERNAAVFEWLRRIDQPFFLCVTYSDARPPYNSLPLPDERSDLLPAGGVVATESLVEELMQRVLFERRSAPESVVLELRRRYELGIAHADRALGELVETLRAEDALEGTVLIVTADQGTFFGERGLVGERQGVAEPGVHVPFVLRAPGAELETVDERHISTADVPGLVATLCGEELAGSLAAAFALPPRRQVTITELHHSARRNVARDGDRVRAVRRVLYVENWKLVQSSDGRNELYDLGTDPEETNNLFDEDRRRSFELSQRLVQYLRENPAPALAEAAPDSTGQARVHELGDVGYSGGAPAVDEALAAEDGHAADDE